MAEITRAEIDSIETRLRAVEDRSTSLEARTALTEKTVDAHHTLLIVGPNGDAPLKEIARAIGRWLEENKDLPGLVRSHEQFFKDNPKLVENVERQGRWIENVNKIGWAIALSAIGIFVVAVANFIVYVIRNTP